MDDLSLNKIDSVALAMEKVIEQAIEIVTVYGIDFIGAIIILLVGIRIASWTAKIVTKGLSKTKKIDETLVKFFSSTARYVVMAFVGIAVLNQFGVQTTSLIAILGAAGLAVGLALQGTLSNVAAGVMLLVFRPFRVGDFVDTGGHSGTITELNLFFTLMTTVDNILITIPNSNIWGNSIINYSANPTRRADFVFGVSYSADLDATKSAILDVIKNDARSHSDPEPLVAVVELGESSVNFVVRVWVNSTDFWNFKFDMNKAVKERFDLDGIEIPFPSRTVYSKTIS